MSSHGSTSEGLLDVWADLDRLAFCEHAILLDAKNRSQGPKLTSKDQREKTPHVGEVQQLIRNFLDDVALVASGPGGKDHVAATCLEWSTTGPHMKLRVARNNGFDLQCCAQLQRVLNMSRDWIVPDLAMLTGDDDQSFNGPFLAEIVKICLEKLKKHVDRLLGELRNAQCQVLDKCSHPAYDSRVQTTERVENVSGLGSYNATNHDQYANVFQHRMNAIRNLAQMIKTSDQCETKQLCQMVFVAYQIYRSRLLRPWLRSNLRTPAKASAVVTMIEDIAIRISKFARVFRAAMVIRQFVAQTAERGLEICVEGLGIRIIPIPELQGRKTAQILARGGEYFQNCHGHQLQSMIRRWSRYRVHAEIQLVAHHEEHPEVVLVSGYIGGNKLCCFLCYQFIQLHGGFEVSGCHQSLYSLWTVPPHLRTTNSSTQESSRFRNALAGLCVVLETRVREIALMTSCHRPHITQRESCDNLSRLSLSSTITVGSLMRTAQASIIRPQSQMATLYEQRDERREDSDVEIIECLERDPVSTSEKPSTQLRLANSYETIDRASVVGHSEDEASPQPLRLERTEAQIEVSDTTDRLECYLAKVEHQREDELVPGASVFGPTLEPQARAEIAQASEVIDHDMAHQKTIEATDTSVSRRKADSKNHGSKRQRRHGAHVSISTPEHRGLPLTTKTKRKKGSRKSKSIQTRRGRRSALRSAERDRPSRHGQHRSQGRRQLLNILKSLWCFN